MDFLTVSLMVALWFVRPQDILPGLAGVPFVHYVMLAGLMAMFARPRGFSPKEVLSTPIDWIMYGYLGWIVWQSEDRFDTAKEVLNLAAFFTCTALALTTKKRFLNYLSLWLACKAVVAALGVCSHFGVDIVQGSAAVTASFGGRLAINTWIFNNPNSLGHGSVAVIPLAYAWLWRGRPMPSKLLAMICWVVAGYCVVLTGSKGAYLAGTGATMVCFLFGKPLKSQLIIIAVVLTAGLSALKALPRMDTLDKNEEGIAARLIIWQQAWVKMHQTDTGAGWKAFKATVVGPHNKIEQRQTHGSYVNVGADLGFPGLFLYVGVLFCAFRCLWQARCGPDPEWDRIQCALLAIMLCYATSAWVIDRAYHTDFFLMTGAVAAFHRVALTKRLSEPDEEPTARLPAWPGNFVPATVGLSYPTRTMLPLMHSRMHERSVPVASNGGGITEGTALTPPVILRWQRLGWPDLGLMFGAFQVVLYLWDYLSTDFISF